MTVQEACAQAFENGRRKGDAEGYARGRKEAVKHGRWAVLKHEDESDCDIYGCSKCRAAVSIAKPRWRYCPNCGARMDGEDRCQG